MSSSRTRPNATEPSRSPSHPPIRKATRDDVPSLALALARAYYQDPVWSFLLPDEARRELALRRYFTIELRDVVLPHDTAWTTERAIGALLSLPPGHWRLSPLTMARRGPAFLRAFGSDLPRSLLALTLLERVHPRVPHYFLAYAGIPPEWQSKGLGSALVSPLLERSDAERSPVYLEATSERAVAFYQRHGFAVTDELRLKNGPPLWLMWRDPRSG
jgi:ribosomal protein S18 acetylase RimI-like enzyme